MGCCSSRQVQGSTARTSVGFQRQLESVQQHQQHTAAVCLTVSQALWTSQNARTSFKIVHIDEDQNLLAGVFEGLDGCEAALFCSQHVVQVYTQLKQTQGRGCSETCLTDVLQRLDQLFLHSAAPAVVRARASASAVLVLVDARAERLLLAATGSSTAVLGRLSGGMAIQQTEGILFSEPVIAPDHLLGGGRHKVQHLADAYSKERGLHRTQVPASVCCQPIASQQRLTAIDEAIVLGSSGLWTALSPDETALRCHFHLKATACVQRSHVATVGPATCPGQLPAALNTARHILAHAVSTTAKARSTRVPAADIAAVVITLHWPATSLNQAFSLDGMRRLLEGEAALLDSATGRAAHRWGQIRSHLEFLRARKRMLTAKWHALVRAVVAAGQQAARRLEERLWLEQRMAVRVSTSGVLTEVNQNTASPAALARQRKC